MGLPGMVHAGWPADRRCAERPRRSRETVFARRLSRAMPAPVTLDNDANLALLGEFAVRAPGAASLRS